MGSAISYGGLVREVAAKTDFKIDLPTADQGDWFVLRTRSRQEKILAADLKKRGIGHYLPLLRAQRKYCNRNFLVELPLFPCYVFLRGTLDDAYWADRSGRVAQIIRVTDQPHLDWELANLATVLNLDMKLDPYPYLRQGTKVEITSGPLRGLQGLVEDRTRKHRVILQVESLGQAVSVEIDAAIVEIIE